MSALGASQAELSGTEAHLVDAARGGDERAFGELYERYGRRILAYVHGMVRDHGRAEDIAQDVFVSALRRMRSTERAISFKPWIYEIAKNACIDEFRRVQRSREVPIEQGSGEHLASTAPSPDSCFEQRQQLDALRGAFRGLSERQHTVIVLRELEGLSYAEIAARTGMTLPMVESTLLRARRRLSEEYDDIASGRRCQQVLTVIEAGGQAAANALGLRERRRFDRHIAHCQPCARQARMAGIAEPQKRVPPLAKKIAGLLPFPFTRWPFSWGPHARSGSHGSGLLRSARRAAQFAHPAASVGVSPATVATMAALVIAGGGAAAYLLTPRHTRPARGTPATVIAPPAAGTRVRTAAPPRTAGGQLGQAAPVARSGGHPAHAARSSGLQATQAHSAAASSSPVTQTSASGGPTSDGPTGGATEPSLPSTPSSIPSLPSAHLPVPVPSSPTLPQGTNLVPPVTTPLPKVIKKIPLPDPLVQGGIGLNSALDGVGGIG